MKDHYAVLGVAPTASTEAVKTAYRRLALQHHPDKVRSQGAFDLSVSGCNAERLLSFQDIQEAYSVLSDDFKRMMYDSERQAASCYAQQATPCMVPPPRGMSATAAAMLRYAERQQFYDDNNSKWESLFQDRHGAIERRPQSRQASRDARRPPIPASAAGSRGQSGGADSSAPTTGDNPPSRPSSRQQQPPQNRVSSTSTLLRRIHPQAAYSGHLHQLVDYSSSFSSPSGSTSPRSQEVAPRTTTADRTRPPLVGGSQTQAAPQRSPQILGDAVLPPRSLSRPSSRVDSRESAASPDSYIPNFKPRSAATPQPQTIKHSIASRQERSFGMSAARRKLLGIGTGSAEATRVATKADVLREQASSRTMALFFA